MQVNVSTFTCFTQVNVLTSFANIYQSYFGKGTVSYLLLTVCDPDLLGLICVSYFLLSTTSSCIIDFLFVQLPYPGKWAKRMERREV